MFDELPNIRNITVNELKVICKKNKLKRSGKKMDIYNRVQKHIQILKSVHIIQNLYRKYIYRKFQNYIGYNLKNPVNDSDFMNLEDIREINRFHQFRFQQSNQVFVFEYQSALELFRNSGNSIKQSHDMQHKRVLNPYNRMCLSNSILDRIYYLYRIYTLLKIPLWNTLSETRNKERLERTQNINQKLSDVFANIHYYTNEGNVDWILSLTTQRLINFILHLNDIWCYRAQLSTEVKKSIVFPTGNPFSHICKNSLNQLTYDVLLDKVCSLLENITDKGVDNSYKTLGCMYVLSALTIVSNQARIAMPLYYSCVEIY